MKGIKLLDIHAQCFGAAVYVRYYLYPMWKKIYFKRQLTKKCFQNTTEPEAVGIFYKYSNMIATRTGKILLDSYRATLWRLLC